ncbi:MAG: SafA/ExsA family spore coat assembly protein [Clostridiaceae bacterium]|jgi:uncharacterized YkwD family protein/spore coat assembly protein SafA|nr:SafA/ExsA family spore coat assembly protein [Clostridiaceae bacterium]
MKKRISLIFFFVLLFSISVFAQPQTYIVKSGDTMWKIASKYQVGTSEIIAANPQIKNPSLIYPGQKLTIPSLDAVKAQENEVIRLVNIQRTKAGLQALTQNWQLSRVARYKSQDMIDRGYFAHNSPTYGSPFKMMESFGLRYSAAGENIAMGQQSPAQVMNAWMNSPGHRNNIMSPSFTQIGVGLAKDRKGRMYWTQMFIKPL